MDGSQPVVDCYEVLGVAFQASDTDIRKAYLQKARDLHPDKNRDRVEWASQQFDILKNAYDVLKDPEARAKLDTKLRASRLQAQRMAEHTAQRQAMQQELERREQAAASQKQKDRWASASQQKTIDRLRADGAAKQEELLEALRKQAGDLLGKADEEDTGTAAGGFDPSSTVHVRWNSKRLTSEFTSDDGIRLLFSEYGKIVDLVARTSNSVCVVYASPAAAEVAVRDSHKLFTVSLLTHMAPPAKRPRTTEESAAAGTGDPVFGAGVIRGRLANPPVLDLAAMEARVLPLLRQAAEVQRATASAQTA